jgi:hypothetical protein
MKCDKRVKEGLQLIEGVIEVEKVVCLERKQNEVG